MDKYTLHCFNEVIKTLRKAKKEYSQKKYAECSETLFSAEGKYRHIPEKLNCDMIREKGDKRRKLTEKERNQLLALNDVLSHLQKRLKEEAEALEISCDKWTKSPAEEFLKDYEIDVKVSYHLDEDDPAFSEDRDNTMATFGYHNVSHVLDDDGCNFNDCDPDDMPPDERPFHGFLFHELCDYARQMLTCRDMLRIGYVWTDIVVRYQNRIDLSEILPVKTETE
ncbi:MAG: hypothetical protein NT178_16660 [Proteobacteria bacterium]|nr:hypothetical protein [Pseudomonadota bacterium]